MLRKIFMTASSTHQSLWFINTTLLWAVPLLLLAFGLPVLGALGLPWWIVVGLALLGSIFFTRVRVEAADPDCLAVSTFWLFVRIRREQHSARTITAERSDDNQTERPDQVVFDTMGRSSYVLDCGADARLAAIHLRAAQNRFLKVHP